MHSWFEHEDKENFLTVVQLMRPFKVALNWQDALSLFAQCAPLSFCSRVSSVKLPPKCVLRFFHVFLMFTLY